MMIVICLKMQAFSAQSYGIKDPDYVFDKGIRGSRSRDPRPRISSSGLRMKEFVLSLSGNQIDKIVLPLSGYQNDRIVLFLSGNQNDRIVLSLSGDQNDIIVLSLSGNQNEIILLSLSGNQSLQALFESASTELVVSNTSRSLGRANPFLFSVYPIFLNETLPYLPPPQMPGIEPRTMPEFPMTAIAGTGKD